jgi:hypothetical protein
MPHAKKIPRENRLILNYLVPILLKRGVLASRAVLTRYPHLAETYEPFFTACKTGNVSLYDRQLHIAEKRLMHRGTYLVVERAREVAVRALLKKAWIVEGKPNRMEIAKFKRCFEIGSGGEAMDSEEVECLIANMIYKVRFSPLVFSGVKGIVAEKSTRSRTSSRATFRININW